MHHVIPPTILSKDDLQQIYKNVNRTFQEKDKKFIRYPKEGNSNSKSNKF